MNYPSISIVMPVFNQEKIIGPIVEAIFHKSSSWVREVIIIIDACTDNTEQVIRDTVNKQSRHIPTLFIVNKVANWEVLCCNQGFKASTCNYSMNFQDDMLIQEQDYDQRMFEPFKHYPNLLAVTARDAVNAGLTENGYLTFYEHRGSREKDVFSVRDIVNRGPLLLDNEKLSALDYLDKSFAPMAHDDTDLCLRAKRMGFIVGSYMTEYYSPLEWGTTRKDRNSRTVQAQSELKNIKTIETRHRDLLLAPKDGFDVSMVYVETDPYDMGTDYDDVM